MSAPNSHNATDRIALAGKVRQLAKEMTVGDPKTAAMLIQAARAIERQPAQQDGPSEREAAIDECRDAAHDAIHHAIERMDLCAFVKGHVDEALLALKNAAPQERSQPVGKGAEATVEGPDHPARASSEAGADDVLWKIRVELAALVANPDKPDWMPALTNGNPADAECLSRAYALTKSNATDSEG